MKEVGELKETELLELVQKVELLEREQGAEGDKRGEASLRGGREGCARVLESDPAVPRTQCAVGVCARRTRAGREHVPTTRTPPAASSGNGTKGRRDSLFPLSFSLFVGELCVSSVEASSVRIELCKFPDCRVRRL